MNVGGREPGQREEPSVSEKLEKLISKKFKIATDPKDDEAMRKAAIRSLRLNKKQLVKVQETRVEVDRLEQHDRKLNDLETIESQFTSYFKNISWKNNYHRTEEEKSGFETLIEKSHMSRSTKGLLKLKARTPFRINLRDFENVELNVKKYYEMIGLDNISDVHIEPSHERSEEPAKGTKEGKPGSSDDHSKFGKFLTQPSFSELPDYLNTQSESLLKVPKEFSLADREPIHEYSFPVKRKLQARKTLFQNGGIKEDTDKASTKYSNATVPLTIHSDFFSNVEMTPQRNFMIKSNFRPIKKSVKKEIESLREKFDDLSNRCTEQSSQILSSKLKTAPPLDQKAKQRGFSTSKLRPAAFHRRKGHRIVGFGDGSNEIQETAEEGDQQTQNLQTLATKQSGSSSPMRKVKKTSLLAPEENNEAYMKTLAGYIEDFMRTSEEHNHQPTKYQLKKQYKKLDTREKMELEVKRMFEASYKGPGGKTGALLASMLHHYISFGTPAASKMEVTQKVREFMAKHKVKISLEEIKKLAAEKHFYITTVQ